MVKLDSLPSCAPTMPHTPEKSSYRKSGCFYRCVYDDNVNALRRCPETLPLRTLCSASWTFFYQLVLIWARIKWLMWAASFSISSGLILLATTQPTLLLLSALLYFLCVSEAAEMLCHVEVGSVAARGTGVLL